MVVSEKCFDADVALSLDIQKKLVGNQAHLLTHEERTFIMCAMMAYLGCLKEE